MIIPTLKDYNYGQYQSLEKFQDCFTVPSETPPPPVWQKTKLFPFFFPAPFPKMDVGTHVYVYVYWDQKYCLGPSVIGFRLVEPKEKSKFFSLVLLSLGQKGGRVEDLAEGSEQRQVSRLICNLLLIFDPRCNRGG